MRLLLMRHGQTHANVAGALDTAVPGLDLTPLGRAQADAVATMLAEQPPQAVYVSPLARTHQTAAPTATAFGVEPVELAGLAEIVAGDYEMATDADSVHGYLGTGGAWVDGDLDRRMPGSEDGHEFMARFDDAIARIAADAAKVGHDTVLAVSHGAAIRTWCARRARHGQRPGDTQLLMNTGCVILDGDADSGWDLVHWHSEPWGGHLLADVTAPDPTAQPD